MAASTRESRGLVGTWAVVLIMLVLLHLTNGAVGYYYGWWESAVYVASVDFPLKSPIDPYYGYRLLPPLIVRHLPVPHPLGFTLVDYASLGGAAWLLVGILVDEGIRRPLALVAAALFLSFPCSTKWLLVYNSGPDAFYLLLIAAAYRCIQRGRWWLFSLLLVAGVFTKVSILVLVPVAWLHGRRSPLSPSSLARLGSALPALAAFWLVQHVWPPAPQVVGVPMEQSVLDHLHMKLFEDSTLLPGVLKQWVEMPMSFFIVFGVVAIMLVVHLPETLRALRDRPAMLAFLAGNSVAMFMGSYDVERCQMYGAIPVLYLWARVVQDRLGIYDRWWVATPLAGAQLWLSEFGLREPIRYELYMSHYMAPRVALTFLITWIVLGLLVIWLNVRAAGGAPPRSRWWPGLDSPPA